MGDRVERPAGSGEGAERGRMGTHGTDAVGKAGEESVAVNRSRAASPGAMVRVSSSPAPPDGPEVIAPGGPEAMPVGAVGEGHGTATRWGRAGCLAGAKAALPLLPGSVVIGVVFGVLSREVGMSGLQAIVMSVLVSAGAAQFIALDLWAPHVPVVGLVVTTLVVNLRNLLIGASLQPWLGPLRGWRRAVTMHFLTDESWALTEVARRRGQGDAAFLIGSGLTVYVGWVVGTAAGHGLGSRLGGLESWDVGFIFTAFFAALLVGVTRGRSDLVPYAVAAVVAVVAQRTLGGTWYILAGGIAGSLAGASAPRPAGG
ncbi:MAG: AzlC family ABC transporter permease [Thermomicrobiales bacterium]